MDKVRVHEIAAELAAHSKDVIDKAIELGLDVKSAQSTLTMEEAEKLMNYVMNAPKRPAAKKPAAKIETPKVEEAQEEVKPAPEKLTEKEEEKTVVPEKADSVKEEVATKEDVVTKEKVATPTEEVVADKVPEEKKPVSVQQRRKGLTIVRKKKPAVAATSQKTTETFYKNEVISSNYGKLSDEAKAELANKKKKSQRKVDTSKQDHGHKMDLDTGFGEGGYDIDTEQIQLIDYRDEQARIDIQEQLKKEQEEQRIKRAQQQAAGGKKFVYNKNRNISRGSRKRRKRKPEEGENAHVSSIEIPEDVRVYEFAEKINKTVSEVITVLFNLGMMVTKNDFLGKDEIEILAEEFDVEVHTIDLTEEFNYEQDYDENDEHDDKDSIERAPIVTIMGHVDHGKTSLLDYIRSSRVAAREAGGITQHIGAYSVDKNGKMITFLDTPGHAAFSAMRQRGADVTDIIIIVVAADDGVKPQTKEAVKQAQESGAPIIVALNKMDKEGAQPDMVKGQMAELGLNPTDWGGSVDFVPLSAKTGDGVEDLLEHILIQTEVLELRANPKQRAKATVVESSIEKGRGPVATIVMQNGTLSIGDFIVSAASSGRVKAMMNSDKKPVKSVGPSETCVVVGLDTVPGSGEILISTDTDKEAKEYAEKRYEHDRHKELSISTKTSLDELSALIAEGNLKALKVILKADVHGSLEAIKTSLETLRNDEVKIQIISSAVGGITQNDVDLASNSENVVILGFNVRPTGSVNASAKQRGVEIKTYSVIYEMIDDMTSILSGMMTRKVREDNTGQATIKEIFSTPKGKIAGCTVDDGKVIRGGKIRVIRDGVVLHVTTVLSLRRFKDEVKEIGKGYECGIALEGFNDLEVGDVFETFIEVEEKAKL